jgi:hypothetical protein
MASKKTATKKVSHEAPKVRILIELSRRARREVDRLLKSNKAGTMTESELNAGLKQAEVPLKQMLDYINATLDDMSKLLKRTQGQAINSKQLSIKLDVVRRRVKRMLNHTNGYHP